MHEYVCCLPTEKELKILAIARGKLSNLAYDVDMEMELENVANSKVCDLTDLIPYEVLREIVED